MKTLNAALASAAAVLFVAGIGGPAAAEHHEAAEKVKCEGANSCKGQSACSTADNACAGHNSCKGKGFVKLSQADCDAAKADGE